MARKKTKEYMLNISGPVEMVSVESIAAALGVEPAAVRKFAKDDPRFPQPHVVLPGGAVRYDADAIRVWLRNSGTSHMNPAGPGRRVRPTFVYFIRCGEFVKIGYAADVAARLATLQTGTPHELEIMHVTPGGVAEEGRLHALFAEERVRPGGEWFRLSARVTDYIAATKSQGGA